MATVKILGDVFQIKSALTEDQIKKAERYSPDLLKIKDEEGNETFAVGVGSSSISKYGICFGALDEEDGKVYVTVSSDGPVTKEDIVESFAPILTKLNFVEGQILAGIDAIYEKEAAVLESIETV